MKIIKKILQNKIVKAFLEYSGIYFSMFGASMAGFWVFIEDKEMVYLISFLLSTVALIGATTQELLQRYLNKEVESEEILDNNMTTQEPSKLVLEIQDRVFVSTLRNIEMFHVIDAIECAEEELDEWGVKLQPRAKREWVGEFAYAHIINGIAREMSRIPNISTPEKQNVYDIMNKSTKIKNDLFKELQHELEWKR
jgi:predicted nucleotidyltransferase